MKVNYVAYLNPFECDGGGERNMRALIEYGRAIGHEIRISSVYPNRKINVFNSPDIFLLVDIHNCPGNRKRLDTGFLNPIVQNEKYVHVDNAYVDVCDMPYLPCNGNVKGELCPFKVGFLDLRSSRLFKNRRCSRNSVVPLYEKAVLNVFASPLHRRIIQNLIGSALVGRYYEYKILLDTNLFYNRSLERDIENLFVGVICEAKGLENMKQRFPDGNIVLIGPTTKSSDKKFGRRVGPVPYHDVPIWMNRAKNFVLLPRWPEPGCRTVVEAALCGCNLITNENVGILSYGFDIGNPSNFSNAEKEFWKALKYHSIKY
jgi:hypothetical protein